MGMGVERWMARNLPSRNVLLIRLEVRITREEVLQLRRLHLRRSQGHPWPHWRLTDDKERKGSLP